MTTPRRSMKAVLPLLLLAAIVGLEMCVGDALVTDISITGQFNFRDNRSPNPAGAAAGDLTFVGATNITPSGSSTTAQAVQGLTTVGVPFLPSILFPNNYAATFPFDPLLTGAWTLTATDAAGPVSVLTNAIPKPELIPLVNSLSVSGALLTPRISWTLPDLTGLGVTRISVRVRDLDRFSIDSVSEQIFQSAFLAPTTTSFDIPANVLKSGGDYSFDVLLDNIVTPTSGPAFLQNRSETFTGVYRTPEPSTFLLLASGLVGLASITWRRLRRTYSQDRQGGVAHGRRVPLGARGASGGGWLLSTRAGVNLRSCFIYCFDSGRS